MYTSTIEENKELCRKYPWLYPRNVWTDEPVEDYDYSYTLLDDMPSGWCIAFGKQMCEEINNVLKKADWVNKYRIIQIKEKFGSLRWYDSTVPAEISDEIQNIIDKYEEISAKTCISCGKPATRISTGWICPWCDDCSKEINGETISFEEWRKM